MREVTVQVQARSRVSAACVWHLLTDVVTWPQWSGFREATYATVGFPDPHGVGAVRAMKVAGLTSWERVLLFVPPHRFAYDYQGPLPFAEYRADVELRPDAEGTPITWGARFTPGYAVTAPLLRWFVGRVLQDTANRLARGAELLACKPA